jgi:hypothetical protein
MFSAIHLRPLCFRGRGAWDLRRSASRPSRWVVLAGALLLLASAGRSARAAATLGSTGTATGTVSGNVTTATPSWSASTTNGSLLVAILTYNGTPTLGATGWTLATSVANGTNVSTAIYYIQNASSQSSATFTATASPAPALTVQLLELQGMLTSSALDVTATNVSSAAATSLTVTPGSTTSSAQEVAIVAFASDNQSNNHAWQAVPAGFTGLSQLSNTTRSISGYDTTVSSGSQLTETMSLKKSANLVGAVVSFKANVTAYYWRGGATTGTSCPANSNWTTAACWASVSGGGANSGNQIPGAGDAAVFEAAEVGGCTISSNITVGSIDVQSRYSGTISHTSGTISLAGSWVFESGTTATFSSTATATGTIRTNQSGSYSGDLILSGGTLTLTAAPLGLRNLTVSGGSFTSGSSAVTLNNAGSVSLASGTVTFGTGGLTPSTGGVTVGGATVSMGNTAFTSSGLVTVSGGSMTFGTGTATFSGGIDVSGGALSTSTAGTTTATSVIVESGSLTFASGTTFTNSANFSQSGGTVTTNGATINMNVASGTDAFTMTGGTFTGGASTITFGQTGHGSGATTTIGGGTFDGSGGVELFQGILTINSGGTLLTGLTGTMMNSGANGNGVANAQMQVILNSGGTLTIGSGGFTFPCTTAMSIDGTLNAGSGTVAFSGPASMTVSSTGTFNGNTSTTTFTNATTIAGTFNGNTSNTTISGAATVSGTFLGNTSTTTFSSTLSVSGIMSAASGTQHFANAVTVSGSLLTGTANLTGTTPATELVTVSSGGTMTLSSAGFAFASTTAMPITGTLNAGSGTVSFAGPITLTGTLNAQSATITVSGALSMTAGAFNGNTGSTTFTVAPSLSGGTFTIGDAGSTGYVLFSAGASFNTTTLAFPTTGGDLKIKQGSSLSVAGIVTSSGGTATPRPKIECSGCSATQGVAMSFTGVTSLDGLEFDNAPTTGVSISGTIATLRHLTFKNNAGNSASGTHLVVTLATQLIEMPGCYFDGTATNNVMLNGTSTAVRGARLILEFQSTTIDGAGAGNLKDLDGDKGLNGDLVANDNYVNGTSPPAPYYGSVVEWANAAPTDTAGISVGFPTAAFDWNTFSYYGVYVAYKQTAGVGTSSVLWNRNSDGSAAYSYTVPSADGDLIGTPYWDTINETTAHVDANGNGNMTDTDVRIVYLATTGGEIIKLVDNGSSLALPASGAWSAGFSDSNVSTITSGLADDQTNLYFGGTTSGTAKVFGVQIAGGTNEAKLVKNIGSVSTVNTTPSWESSGGTTYVFLGSTASTNAYIYRINITNGSVDASYNGSTTNINGAIVLVNNVAYGASSGGTVYAINAFGASSGGFINVTGFPYTTTAKSAIMFSPWVDNYDSTIYFGDSSANVYYLTSSGTLTSGYPLQVSTTSGVTITSTPLYRHGSGVICVGASDGYMYFIDRSGVDVFKRFFVSASGSVSSIAYDSAASVFMASSSDGKLVYVNAADVTDPTPPI